MSLAGTWYNARADKTIEVKEDSDHPLYGRLGPKTFYKFTGSYVASDWTLVAPSVLKHHLEICNYKKIPDTEVYEDLLWE